MAPSEITDLGLEYLNRTRRHREGAPYFTDKMPNNFAHIGLILATMPNAKIIDARRHPLDSCIGCYKQHFARGQTYTYDLFELAEFYLEYDEMMSHWQKVAPDRVLRVQYEDVVNELEDQVREYWTTANCRLRKAVSIFIRPSEQCERRARSRCDNRYIPGRLGLGNDLRITLPH